MQYYSLCAMLPKPSVMGNLHQVPLFALSKAFNTVDHQILPKKPRHDGVNENWFGFEIIFSEEKNILKIMMTEVVVRRCSIKKVFLETSQNSQENSCARNYFLIKLQAKAWNFIKKESLTQMFSCEISEIFKNTFFYRTPATVASFMTSNIYLKLTVVFLRDL